MILPALFFYLFAAVCVASAVMVIVSRNPVHSVLFLILAFVNAAGLFILMGAEFLGMMLIVVYVGAVAVLFLFVIMMLDVDFVELREGFAVHLDTITHDRYELCVNFKLVLTKVPLQLVKVAQQHNLRRFQVSLHQAA